MLFIVMQKSIYTNDYQKFLQLLREARLTAGLSQEEVAKRLRQTQSFISKYERGERRLDIVETSAICAAIGVSFPEFVADFMEAINIKLKRNLKGT